MTKTEIEEYLLKIEHQLLIGSERHTIKLTREWAQSFPNEAGVYIFRENGEVCYVGETGNLRGRMSDILNTQNHNIRRNIGHSYFSNLPNFQKASSKRKFDKEIELLLSDLMEKNLTVSVLPVNLGRKEMEERLCEKLHPKYNLKGKRGVSKKAYTKADKQLKDAKAYEPWTDDADKELEKLFHEGKRIAELSKIFQRNEGAIHSRIRKLGLKEKYSS